MKKILYIDFPFTDVTSPANLRSRFLGSILCRYCDADLMLVKTEEYLTKQLPEHKGFEQTFSISCRKPGKFGILPVLQFSRENIDKLTQILRTKRYEMAVLRGIRFYKLFATIESVLPNCRIVVTPDTLTSAELLGKWRQNPTWKNRMTQIAYWAAQALERSIFRRNYHFIFAQYADLKIVQKLYFPVETAPNVLLLPNPLPKPCLAESNKKTAQESKSVKKEKYILFYGNLASEANLDAFCHLVKDIYPRVSSKLQEKDIKFYVAGNNHSKLHEQLCGGRIKLIGASDDLPALIKGCLFVVLPIRKQATAASRILETGQLHKAVLTTSAGAYDSGLGNDALAIEDKVDGFCTRMIEMLSNPGMLIELGERLNAKILSEFTDEVLAEKLRSFICNAPDSGHATPAVNRLSIAIVTNSFGDDADKMGIHIYRFALKLSETADVTVYCPRSNQKPFKEVLGGVKIVRLLDLYRFLGKKRNTRNNALFLGLLSKLLKGDYDIIQCYPGLSHNYTLAFLASKLKEAPIILNVFTFQDNEQIVKDDGKDDKNIFGNKLITSFKQALLKNTDYLFTVTERQYACIRKLNDRVQHIPAPLLLSDYENATPLIREKYDIGASTFVYLCLGKVTYLKGQDLALKAFISILPSLQNAKLVFVGSTAYDQEFFEDLEALVIREALQDDIIFTGEVEHSELLAWLKTSDIHLVPARFMNVSNVVIESWACGTAVLQSDVVDPNLVIEDINGYLFRSEDVEDLAQQMLKVFNNRAKLAETGEHGKALVKEKYTFEYLVKRYQKVYYQLTEGM